MLLKAGAELEYTNCRMWTSARYIFEPHRQHRDSVKLLELFAGLENTFWNAPDRVGWTILHRAAAFGTGEDVRKILLMQGSPTIRTFKLNWLPIFCAVEAGNESTFEVLLAVPVLDFAKLKDTRGWNLLHLAAQSGSLAILSKLLYLGIHPEEKTIASSLLIPDELKAKKLTSEIIARHYQNENIYNHALKAAGWAANGK
jgi:ankyrin repeat protein